MQHISSGTRMAYLFSAMKQFTKGFLSTRYMNCTEEVQSVLRYGFFWHIVLETILV